MVVTGKSPPPRRIEREQCVPRRRFHSFTIHPQLIVPMARFIVRVELDSASPAHYGRLHSAMALRGFSTTISSANGASFQLPCAEYYREGRYKVQQVLVDAKAAATAVSNSFSILVSETTNSAWEGLKEATYSSVGA